MLMQWLTWDTYTKLTLTVTRRKAGEALRTIVHTKGTCGRANAQSPGEGVTGDKREFCMDCFNLVVLECMIPAALGASSVIRTRQMHMHRRACLKSS